MRCCYHENDIGAQTVIDSVKILIDARIEELKSSIKTLIERNIEE